MTSALRSLHGPMRRGWVTALSAVTCGVGLAALWSCIVRPFFRSDPATFAYSIALTTAGAVMLRALSPRVAGIFASSLVNALLLPVLLSHVLMPLAALSMTTVRSYGEGYGDAVTALFAAGLVALTVLVVCGLLSAAQFYVGGRSSSRLRALWSALLVGVVLLAGLRLSLEPPNVRGTDWLQALPRVGAIPAVDAARRGDFEESYTVGSLRLRRQCSGGGCMLRALSPPNEPLRPIWRAAHHAAEVRYVARLDVMIFVSPTDRYAFHRATGEPVNVRAWHMASGRAPPRSWVLAALAGLAASALALAAFRRPPPSLLAWRGARAGLLSADGAITFGEGAADLRLPDARGLAPGPMLVLFAQHTREAGPFRGTTARDVEAVAPGTHDDVEAAVAHVEDSAASLALLLATTACAPLLVEAACQMLV